MSAKRIVNPPVLDGKAFVEPLAKAFPTSSGTQRPVYGEPFPKFLRWLRGDSEFDGTGVKDVVNANAQFTDDIKGDVDEHAQRLAELESRVAAVEARPSVGFPFA